MCPTRREIFCMLVLESSSFFPPKFSIGILCNVLDSLATISHLDIYLT